jgi:hypothetical protein
MSNSLKSDFIVAITCQLGVVLLKKEVKVQQVVVTHIAVKGLMSQQLLGISLAKSEKNNQCLNHPMLDHLTFFLLMETMLRTFISTIICFKLWNYSTLTKLISLEK